MCPAGVRFLEACEMAAETQACWETPAWAALKEHVASIEATHLRTLMEVRRGAFVSLCSGAVALIAHRAFPAAYDGRIRSAVPR